MVSSEVMCVKPATATTTTTIDPATIDSAGCLYIFLHTHIYIHNNNHQRKRGYQLECADGHRRGCKEGVRDTEGRM